MQAVIQCYKYIHECLLQVVWLAQRIVQQPDYTAANGYHV